MKKTVRFNSDASGFEQAMAFIWQFIQDSKVEKKARVKARLVAEEALGSLMAHRKDDQSAMRVTARAGLGSIYIELSMPGEAYGLAENMASASMPDSEDVDASTQEVIRNIMLRSLTDDLKYQNKDGVNYVRMTLVKSKQAFLWQTLGAMLAAILVGLILRGAAPQALNGMLNDNLLIPIRTMYMNALKMVVAPVVFFSIVTCIMQFSDMSALGRIGGKTLLLYLCTTLIAVGVGVGAFYLFKPGSADALPGPMVDTSAITSQTMRVSIRDTVVGIVPTNFLDPFLKSNMLQLIFLAVLSGVATGLIGKYSSMLKDIFRALNDLFLKITTMIIHVMPLAVFCAITSMVLTMGFDSLLCVMSMMGTFLFGLACMALVYCLMMTLMTRLNPIIFFKKCAPVLLQVFSMGSSNPAIPLNMNLCEKQLGISGKVYSLSIPLGATLNMDGTCIHLAVFALALAKIYSVPVTGAMLLSLVVSIIVLSIGAPGIPGSGLICLSVLLTQMNMPLEAIGLVMGIDSLAGMFRAMSNCLGDLAVTSIVARSEGELDMKVYRQK